MQNKKMIRVHMNIVGDVQGVFFRAHTQEKAQELRLTGWVGNNADGTVDVVAEGPENLVDDLVQWCQSGPSTSTVDKVEVHKEQFTDEFTDFEIRY